MKAIGIGRKGEWRGNGEEMERERRSGLGESNRKIIN